MILEIRYKIISSGGYIGPYVKITNQDELVADHGHLNEWVLKNALEWTDLKFKISRTDVVRSIGFKFSTNETHTGPATLLVERVKITSYPFSVLATSRGFSQEISAFTSNLPIFPMSPVQYLSTFYGTVNYTISVRNLDLSISGITSILRTGPFDIEIDDYPNCDYLCEQGSFDDFRELHSQLRFGFIIHSHSSDWELLDILLAQGAVELVDSWDDYEVYTTTIV